MSRWASDTPGDRDVSRGPILPVSLGHPARAFPASRTLTQRRSRPSCTRPLGKPHAPCPYSGIAVVRPYRRRALPLPIGSLLGGYCVPVYTTQGLDNHALAVTQPQLQPCRHSLPGHIPYRVLFVSDRTGLHASSARRVDGMQHRRPAVPRPRDYGTSRLEVSARRWQLALQVPRERRSCGTPLPDSCPWPWTPPGVGCPVWPSSRETATRCAAHVAEC